MARVVTQALLDALRVSFNDAFKRGKTKAKPISAFMSTPVPSSAAINTYGFLGDLPMFREWKGEKRVQTLLEKAYQLLNIPYEVTLGIHKHQISDDELGLYGAIFEGWGEEGELWMERLRWAALAEGHARPCFDGQYFFDTDHPTFQKGGGTYANMDADTAVEPWFLLDCSKSLKPTISQEREAPHFWWINDLKDSEVARTGMMTAYGEARGAVGYTLPYLAYRSRKALDAASYVAARDAMAAYTDDNGDPRGIKPTHIVFGASNRSAAENLFDAQLGAGGASNIHYKALETVFADRLK